MSLLPTEEQGDLARQDPAPPKSSHCPWQSSSLRSFPHSPGNALPHGTAVISSSSNHHFPVLCSVGQSVEAVPQQQENITDSFSHKHDINWMAQRGENAVCRISPMPQLAQGQWE